MPPFLLIDEPVTSLSRYVEAGGGQGLDRARSLGAGAVIDELRLARLRGRGGAGFPTATKWRSVLQGGGPRYAVCNAAEGEPATFKDRALLRANPYQVLEGLLIASEVVSAEAIFVATKASFGPERAVLEGAAVEMANAGWTDRPVQIVAGPEEYLFGEEKAMLEVIEGNDPLPRWLPPYLHGLFAAAPQLGWEAHAEAAPAPSANPTLVNNVETLANVAHIVRHGAEWFRSMGTEDTPGTLCCTVVGDVERPGVVEVEAGTPLGALLDRVGGPAAGRRVKAVFSGVSNPVLTVEHLGVPLSHDTFTAVGSGLGAAGFMVYDDSTCLVEVAAMWSRFLWVESCGQCPPCKLGTGDITETLDRIARGEGVDGDVDRIGERLRIVTDGSRCFLPEEERRIVSSILRSFPEDVAAHLEGGSCPGPRTLPIPKIVDLSDGVVTWDERQRSKRPDWTYAD